VSRGIAAAPVTGAGSGSDAGDPDADGPHEGGTAVGGTELGGTAMGATEPGGTDAGSADMGSADAGSPVDAARLRVAIMRMSRRLRKHELAGLTPTQLSALSTVELAGPVRLGDLAAAERIAPSTLTRLVSVLEECGYVRRCAVPEDARASTVSVTDRGRSVLSRIRQETTSLLAESLLLLPPGQQAALAAALPALEQLAGAIPADPRPQSRRGRSAVLADK